MAWTTKALFVPINDAPQAVELPLESLPEDVDAVLQLLKGEIAPLDLWIDVAKAYLCRGKINQFVKILDSGRQPDVESYHPNSHYERMKILCLLASYFVATARTYKPAMKLQRDQAFAKALTYLNQASLIQTGNQEMLPLVGRGMLQLAKGELALAKKSFEEASRRKDNGRRSIVGLLGKAKVCCMQGEWEEALACYRDCLIIHPNCPVSVRNGIGICSMKLGYIKQAECAFTRVLQLDNHNITALAALAVIRVNEGKSLEGPQKIAKRNQAAAMLKLAFESPAGPCDPNVLSGLSFLFLEKGDFATSGGLAAKAYEHAADRPKLQAESMYVTACACHAQGLMKEAKQNYTGACEKDPSFPLPFIGLGQMFLYDGGESSLKLAAESFEKACKGIPLSTELQTIVGELYLESGIIDKAVESLKAAIISSPRNADAHRLLGDCYVMSDAKLALHHYEEFLKLTQNALEKQELSANYVFLLNNTGTMYYRRRQYHNACTAFYSALESLQQAKNVPMEDDLSVDSELIGKLAGLLKPGAQITIAFNLARALEEVGNIKLSRQLYSSILSQIPGYLDCHLRLASIWKKLGSFSNALGELQKAEIVLESDMVPAADKPDLKYAVMAMRISLSIEMRKWPETKDLIRKMKAGNNGATSKLFPSVAEGNLNFITTPRSRSKMDETEKKRIHYHLTKAMDYFAMVLKETKGCAYAANGMGMVLSREHKFGEARQAFTAVQEAAVAEDNQSLLANALYNLAQMHLLSKDFATSAKLSETYLQRFAYGHDDSALLCRAKALFEEGKLLDAKEVLQKALHNRPSNLQIRFNLAYVLQEYSTRVFVKEEQKIGTRAKFQELDSAAKGLEQAMQIFGHLRSIFEPDHARLGYDATALDIHLEHCKKNHHLALGYVSKRKEALAMEEARMKEEQERYEQAKREDREEQERLKRIEEEERERQEEQARQAQEKLEMLKEQWKLQSGPKQSESKRKKRKKEKPTFQEDFLDEEEMVVGGGGLEAAGLVSSDEEDGLLEDDMEGITEREKAKDAPRNLRALGLEDSSDEDAQDEDVGSKRKRTATRIEDEEEFLPSAGTS